MIEAGADFLKFLRLERPEFEISRSITKAELLQLNRTQFPSLGIFVSKIVGNQKN